MQANIQKVEEGYLVQFERHLKHSVEKVWSYLTENEKLVQWFSELKIVDLRQGGIIKFDMQNGTFIDITILELKMQSVLEFTWDEDVVRFELYPESGGCRLILKERLGKMTSHTPRDIAGWHVCLDVVQALLDGRTIESREDEWNKWYEKYIQAVRKVSGA